MGGKTGHEAPEEQEWNTDTSLAGTVSFKSTGYSFWLNHSRNILQIRFAAMAIPPSSAEGPVEGPSTLTSESRAWQRPGKTKPTWPPGWDIPEELTSSWGSSLSLGWFGFFFKLLLEESTLCQVLLAWQQVMLRTGQCCKAHLQQAELEINPLEEAQAPPWPPALKITVFPKWNHPQQLCVFP